MPSDSSDTALVARHGACSGVGRGGGGDGGSGGGYGDRLGDGAVITCRDSFIATLQSTSNEWGSKE